MRVLVFDEWLPWPLECGKKIRTFNLLANLAARHEILYLSYVNLPEEREKIRVLEEKGIHVIPVDDQRTPKWTLFFYLKVLRNFFSKEPFSSDYHINPNFIQKMLEVVQKEKPDLLHCEWTNLAPLLGYVTNIPRVIASHNVESDIWKRLAENSRNPFTRVLANQQSKKIMRLEREWYPKVEHCTAVSSEDEKVISSYGARVSVVENGVDIERYDARNAAPQEVDRNRLIFTASFETFSNQDAVDFLVEAIFPLVIRQNPKVNLWIVGKDPSKKIKNYARKHSQVYVTGTVPDVRDYILKSAICVVPIRIAGGSRLKIVEALALKKPVISTTIGAEGLRVKDDENILLADTPKDFADKLLALLNDPGKQKSLGRAGWELVRTNYDWKVLAEKQSEIWTSLMPQR